MRPSEEEASATARRRSKATKSKLSLLYSGPSCTTTMPEERNAHSND